MFQSDLPPQIGSEVVPAANGHSPAPAAGAAIQHPPLSIADRRDLLLFLMRVEATFDQDKLFCDAVHYFLWQVMVKKFMRFCQEDAPTALSILDALAAECERDKQLGDAIRERLRRILGGQGEGRPLTPQNGQGGR